MFNYYNLNKNSNFGFFKHSNDDYNYINLKKLAPSNPYIGYFSQYQKDNFFGLPPNFKEKFLPYKKENSNRIVGSFSNFIKDKSNNLIQKHNFVSFNHCLLGDKLLIPENLIPVSSSISERIINTDVSKVEIENIENSITDSSSISKSIINKDESKVKIETIEISKESLISYENQKYLYPIKSQIDFNEFEDEYVLV